MLNLVVFETEEELCELTGLTEEELWQKGFNLDDWEIGIDRINEIRSWKYTGGAVFDENAT